MVWQAVRDRLTHALSFVGSVAALLMASMAAAPAAGAQVPYIETPVHSLAPDASNVSESYVSLYSPLPAADGPHPAACDRIGYLRFRAVGGPSNPAHADAVFVAQPGIFEAAGALDQVARNTIREALERGYHVEFWALDPRADCLEDTFGVQVGTALRSPQPAIDYYYGGKSVFGRTFPGFVTEQQATWLSHVGLAQTVQDEYTVVSQLPPSVRQARVFCGGHSLGGIVTAAFVNWDFSGTGDPAYAGYNQCAGYFGLDTRLELQLSTAILSQSIGGVLSSILQAASSGYPYINLAPFTPETFAALPVLGLASYFQPNQVDHTVVNELPNDFNFNVTYRVLFGNSWLDLITDNPDIRQFNATNQAVIGELFGTNQEPIGILRAGLGVVTGGPVVEKTFPLPYGSPAALMGLIGGPDQVSPAPASATPSGPLYSWLNYNQVPDPGPSPADDPGQPYTSSAYQMSDITQLSRTLFDSPSMFTEDYFPTQLVLDVAAAAFGDRSGSLANLRYTDGADQRPAAYIDAGSGVTPQLPAALQAIPPGPSPQVHVVAPGYNHLDVDTAAWTQNNGQPEITSSTLANWISQIVGPPAG
jgi:hypothetical protein